MPMLPIPDQQPQPSPSPSPAPTPGQGQLIGWDASGAPIYAGQTPTPVPPAAVPGPPAPSPSPAARTPVPPPMRRGPAAPAPSPQPSPAPAAATPGNTAPPKFPDIPPELANDDSGWGHQVWEFAKAVGNNTIVPLAQAFINQGNPGAYAAAGRQAAADAGTLLVKSKMMWDAGNKTAAAGYLAAAALPGFGQQLAQSGEDIGSGETGKGLGEAVAAIAPFGVHPLFKWASESPFLADVGADTAAPLMDRMAKQRLLNVAAPVKGANKIRLGASLANVAPDVLTDPDLAAWSRAGFQDKAALAGESTNAQLNDAYDALPKDEFQPTAPLKSSIKTLIQQKQVTGVRNPSDLEPQGAQTKIDPTGNQARLDALNTALGEVNALGDGMNGVNLRKLAQSWDNMAKLEYTPDTATDFQKLRGTGAGFADASQMLRNYIKVKYPQIAPLAERSHYIGVVNTVMEAAENAQQAPSVPGGSAVRRMGEALTFGGLAHMAGADPATMLGTAALAPILDMAATSGATSQIMVGRALTKFAQALRDHQGALAQASLKQAETASGAKPGSILTAPVMDSVSRLWQGGKQAAATMATSDETGAVGEGGRRFVALRTTDPDLHVEGDGKTYSSPQDARAAAEELYHAQGMPRDDASLEESLGGKAGWGSSDLHAANEYAHPYTAETDFGTFAPVKGNGDWAVAAWNSDKGKYDVRAFTTEADAHQFINSNPKYETADVLKIGGGGAGPKR